LQEELMEYRVLGPLEVRDGERSLPLAGAKQRALLALLLVNANHVVSRDRLIDELWGEQPPGTAVASLQVYVSRLRKLLPQGTLLTRPPGYLLEVAPDELDLRRFERLLAEGRETLAHGESERASTVLREALALWRGPALAEFAFDRFAQAEIGRLEDLRLAAVEQRIEADLALGRHADLIGELEALIAENPHREHLRAELMLALYRSGRQAEALEAYQDARRALVDELGIEPSAALQRLEKLILTQDKELDAPPRRQVGREIARQPAPTLALERKRVTVLFADLGMTDETEEDPEQAGALLDRIGDEAAAEIEAAGGTVEKGLAGALLATFGAQAARQEDHAVRAVSAALATRRRLTQVFGDALSLRMGVASGEVILGRPGSFVTGTPVAAAARLVRFAQPGEIIVGERTATATAGAFELQERSGAYVLVGALAPTRSPAQIARQRRRRRRLTFAGLPLVAAAIAAVIVYATRPSEITVTPNSVGIIDPTSNNVVGQVGVGSRPDGVAVGEGAVWVANLDDKTLSRVDPEKRAVTRTISLDATPTGLAIGFGAVWVAHGLLGTVSRVAPQYTGVETIRPPFAQLVGGSGAHGSIAVGAGSVWVAFGDSSVSRIDPASRRIVATTVAGNAPSAVACGSRSVWVANEGDSRVSRINPDTNGRFSLPITVGLRPNGVAVGGGAVWVADTGDNRVSRIDPGSGSATSFSVGRAPLGIAYGAGSVWVVNSGDGTVSRIDPATSRVIATIRVGNSPRRVAVGAGKVWVTVEAPPRAT
jgi:YVTN family beta-propeller protein